MHGKASLVDTLFLVELSLFTSVLWRAWFDFFSPLFRWWINFQDFFEQIGKTDWLEQILWPLLFLCSEVIYCLGIFLILYNELLQHREEFLSSILDSFHCTFWLQNFVNHILFQPCDYSCSYLAFPVLSLVLSDLTLIPLYIDSAYSTRLQRVTWQAVSHTYMSE